MNEPLWSVHGSDSKSTDLELRKDSCLGPEGVILGRPGSRIVTPSTPAHNDVTATVPPMRFDLDDLDDDVIGFLTERHLATLTTHAADGGLQVTPVGVTYEPDHKLARVITWATSIKARNVQRRPNQQVAVCQVDGGRWLTLYGRAAVSDDEHRVAEAVERYAARYRQPKERTDRVVIEVQVDRLLGRA